jgi:hypothetical protein
MIENGEIKWLATGEGLVSLLSVSQGVAEAQSMNIRPFTSVLE